MGETKPTEEPDIIEVFEHEDGCIATGLDGIDGRCPFSRDVESTSVRPDACDHPKNELKKVDGVWQDGCGLKGGRDVIPAHCPLRQAPTIIRLKVGA